METSGWRGLWRNKVSSKHSHKNMKRKGTVEYKERLKKTRYNISEPTYPNSRFKGPLYTSIVTMQPQLQCIPTFSLIQTPLNKPNLWVEK
jgi:hypothetical protein